MTVQHDHLHKVDEAYGCTNFYKFTYGVRSGQRLKHYQQAGTVDAVLIPVIHVAQTPASTALEELKRAKSV